VFLYTRVAIVATNTTLHFVIIIFTHDILRYMPLQGIYVNTTSRHRTINVGSQK